MPNPRAQAQSLIHRVWTLCSAPESRRIFSRSPQWAKTTHDRSLPGKLCPCPVPVHLLFVEFQLQERRVEVAQASACGFCSRNGRPRYNQNPQAEACATENFQSLRLRFLRRAPEERRNIKVVRSLRILLVNHFVDNGTRRFLRNLLRHNDRLFFVAPG